MKKILITILLISSVAFSQTEKQVGEFSKVTSFDKIEVTLIKSTENKVVLTGTNAEEVELVSKNGELKIRMPLTKLLSGDGVKATVYYANLEAVEANEGSRITGKDEIKSINFDIICKEGSEIKLSNLHADRLKVKAIAGSNVTINGKVKNQDIVANAGATYDGENCISEQTVVTVNAGGIAAVNASNFVDAKTRAGGEIEIYGNPKQINQKTIAGGSIKQVN